MYFDLNIMKMCIKRSVQSVMKCGTIAVKCYSLSPILVSLCERICFISVLLGVFPVGSWKGRAWDNALFLISNASVGEWQQIYHLKLFSSSSFLL